jgi:hypothetical protein
MEIFYRKKSSINMDTLESTHCVSCVGVMQWEVWRQLNPDLISLHYHFKWQEEILLKVRQSSKNNFCPKIKISHPPIGYKSGDVFLKKPTSLTLIPCFQSKYGHNFLLALMKKSTFVLCPILTCCQLPSVLTIYITVFVTRGRHFGARESVWSYFFEAKPRKNISKTDSRASKWLPRSLKQCWIKLYLTFGSKMDQYYNMALGSS